MLKNLMLSALLSSAIASNVPLSFQNIDNFQYLYKLGSYDTWLDVSDTDVLLAPGDYGCGYMNMNLSYHIVYDLYSINTEPITSSYDNFYVKLYTLNIEFNPYINVAYDGGEYYTNLLVEYEVSNPPPYYAPRSYNMVQMLNDYGHDTSTTLFSYDDLIYYTTINFSMNSGLNRTLYVNLACDSYTSLEWLDYSNALYSGDYVYLYDYMGNHKPNIFYQKDICISTSLVYPWYEILDNNIASAEKITASYNDGYNTGYQNGYGNGFNDGQNADETITTIFNGIFGVALLPINMFLQIFNFEVMGINISGIVTALLTVAVIVIVVKFVTGKKVSGGEE